MEEGHKQKEMSRKGSSGMQSTTYTQYLNYTESFDGLGYKNGGATDQWMNGLSSGEKTAVKSYCDDYYIQLNKALRKGDSMSPMMKTVDKNLHSALEKFDLEKPTVFIRGSSASLLGGPKKVGEINAMKGSIVHDKGYTSSSATLDDAFYEPYMYHIRTPAGKGIGAYVVGISTYGSAENEFLFDKGSAFKILGAKIDSKGRTQVDLEYVGKS